VAKHDIDWYLERLEGVEGDRQSGIAWCCCHDDVGSSHKGLSYTVRPSGQILMNCHSPQCAATLTRVTKELEQRENGYEEDEELDITVNVTRNGTQGDGMTWWTNKTGVPAKTWEGMGCVADGAGIRFEFEGFECYKKRAPDRFSWVGTKEAEAPPFWPAIPDVMPKHMHITEGESDAGTLQENSFSGVHACTKGAKTPLLASTFEALKERGVSEVTVYPDADDPGSEFSVRTTRAALSAGLTVNVCLLQNILDPFSGLNDLNGIWRATGKRKKDFKDLLRRATERLATRITFNTVKEMEDIAEREVGWLIPELIAPSDKIMIAAPQKSLKSWLALELTRSLTSCSPLLKRPEWTPTQELTVGFVQEEGAPSLWARRIAMLGISGRKNALFSHRTGFRFTESSFTDELIATAREEGFDFLILDPLQRMVPGLDENSSSEMGVIWDEVFRIQQACPGLVVCIVHHANKQDRLTWESTRGTSRHAGEVDLGIFLERHPLEENTLRMWLDGRDIPQYLGTGENFNVTYEIDREKKHFSMSALEIDVTVNNPQVLKGQQNRLAILKAVEEGYDTRTKLMHQVGISDAALRNHLDALVAEGKLAATEKGAGPATTYRLAETDE
jgi:AAA domain